MLHEALKGIITQLFSALSAQSIASLGQVDVLLAFVSRSTAPVEITHRKCVMVNSKSPMSRKQPLAM